MHDLYAVTWKTGEAFQLAKERCSALLTQVHPTMFYIYTSNILLPLPHLACLQLPLPLVVPPPHAHDPPDMHTSLL